MDADAIAAAASQSERDATSAMFQRLALEASTADMPSAVNHIAVKLPDFWTKEPELWFMQAETTFRRAKITCSLTKYDYVLQRLHMDVLVSVKELARRVRTGEVDDPYEQLEKKLTASYQQSPWQLTFDLLDMPDLGDRRPSVLMDTMLASGQTASSWRCFCAACRRTSVTNWWHRISRSLPLWPPSPIVSMMRDRKAARCRLCIKWLERKCAQQMAAHPLLRAVVARPIAGTGAAGERRGGVVMPMATAMASVFTTQTLVRVPPGAGPPVAGRETDWPPMARATNCCRRTDFSEGGRHR
jgi:hypothetical protein